jgi:outer membrane protein TolC
MFHRYPLSLCLGVLAFALAGQGQAAPLSFQAALDLAVKQAPSLAARQARVEAARAQQVGADALPDPKLFVGVDNLPVTGADRWHLDRDFMTMRKVGLMQEVPNGAKRQARADAAAAEVDLSEAERRVERTKVRAAVAQAWLTRYYLEQRRTLFTELEQENHLLADAVRAQLAGGRGQAADIVGPKQEATQLADREDELQRDLAKAHGELRRWIGDDADEPLSGAPAALVVDPAAYHAHLHEHPELAAYASASQKAEADVREAVAAKRPDWGVELSYAQRAPQFGDMVSVQFTFDLPLFGKTHQNPQIAARRQQVAQLDAERDAMLREHGAELESDLADYASLGRQLDRAHKESLALAEQKVALTLADYRAGKVDLSNVLAARRERVEQRLRLIDLEQQRQAVAAKLYFSYGEGAQ